MPKKNQPIDLPADQCPSCRLLRDENARLKERVDFLEKTLQNVIEAYVAYMEAHFPRTKRPQDLDRNCTIAKLHHEGRLTWGQIGQQPGIRTADGPAKTMAVKNACERHMELLWRELWQYRWARDWLPDQLPPGGRSPKEVLGARILNLFSRSGVELTEANLQGERHPLEPAPFGLNLRPDG